MLIFSGGKTAGHVYPLIALIKAYSNECMFVGNYDSIEEKICKENNISFIGINKKNNKILNMLIGYKELKEKLKSYQIDGIIATGGFTSSGACLYAYLKNIPLFLIEENVILGDVNRLFSFYAKRVFLAYEVPSMRKNFMITGLPIRSNIGTKEIDYDYDVLVIGGSLGSRPLCAAASIISNKNKVVLIAGKYYKEYEHSSSMRVIEYTNDIYSYIKKARVVVSRAGASTLQEIMYFNKPMIIIPSEKTKRNHQVLNAEFLKEKKCAIIIKEANVKRDLNRFVELILRDNKFRNNLLNNQSKLVNLNAKHLILSKIKEDLK